MGGLTRALKIDALDTRSGDQESSAVLNGRYEIVRRLGRGGMGAVYVALDRHRNNAEVALKRIRRDRADEKTFHTIKNEFLILSQFRHPNVVRVFDFGTEGTTGDIFFTSEIVRGPDWQKLVRDLELDQDVGRRVFLSTVADILRGLAFIHSQGFVHLDIKPDNVLVQLPEGDSPLVAKLIDFGLVRREKEFGGKKIMGTTYYIAPETILGARVDGRTDLYSFGAVLYHFLCGKVPFAGRSNIEIFKGHLPSVRPFRRTK